MEEWIKNLNIKSQQEVWEKYQNAKNDDERTMIHYFNHSEGQVNEIPIKHLDEFLRCIRLVSTTSTWFRGESKEHKLLIPKLYRGISENQILQALKKEKQYFQEFRRRAISLVDGIDKNDLWTWYFLIQHYGGPTRLLDWTSNATVALFMALNSSQSRKDNPVVYLMASTILTDYAFNDIGRETEETARVLYPGEDGTDLWISNLGAKPSTIPDSPISLLPAYSDSRITSQKSCFTLFGKRLNGFVKNNQQITCTCCDQKILNKIIISGDAKQNLLSELARIGITSETIYPGLEGLTQEINNELSGKYD